ncbi:hypothetical protein GE09DRAFT_142479 [Coniochaeta sp. 2T2.1]|nr:hypothetical protein GE09DRAFT_142479 [Coniochaeta sp. 2T2.1]
MSTEKACAIAIDIQHGSNFFTIPIELRRAVYAHLFDIPGQHIRYVVDGGDGVQHFRLTPCIAPPVSDKRIRHGDERNPYPRSPDGFAPEGPLYFRRLLSSWGPHWMCEELACHFKEAGDLESMFPPSHDFSSALRVCKRMYSDLVEIVTTSTDFHVTDLQTLEALLGQPEHTPAIHFSFEGSICPRITRLSITLSMSLAFFQEIEAASLAYGDQDGAASSAGPEEHNVMTWTCMTSRLLVQLPKLRKLRVWLDHNGIGFWSVVNERAILGPMEVLKKSNPGLELVCVLPKVHPKIEDRQRHYLPEDEEGEASSSRLHIHRVLRQRYRVVTNGAGSKYVTYVKDFPHILGNPVFDNMSLAEKEKSEARFWRRGVDINQLSTNHIGTIMYSPRTR